MNKHLNLLYVWPFALLALGLVSASGAGPTVVSSSAVTDYDFALFGGKAHVVYATGGNIYYRSRVLTGTTWSDAELIGAGSAPSIAFSGGAPFVSYAASATQLKVATASGGSWTNSVTYAVSNLFSTMVRADAAGKLHLLINQNVQYGSVDYASRENGVWSSLTNLARGWYDSGIRTGNYFYQARLATAPDTAGYKYVEEFQRWGGQASWSDKIVDSGGGPSGLPSWSAPGTGWNTGITLGKEALSLGPGGRAVVGYAFGSTGYLRIYDGLAWSETNLGSASDIAVWSDPLSPGETFAFFVAGGILKSYENGAVSSFTIDSASVTGTKPMFAKSGGGLELYYLNSSGQLLSYSTIPEPGTVALWAVGVLVLVSRWRCRRAAER